MNQALENAIVGAAVDILRGHASDGTPISKDEASLIMMASQIGVPPPKTGMEKFVDDISQLGKLAPLVMGFFGLGGSS